MSDGTAILRAILADPADDTARLVYADWLDERDEPLRAELIRIQIERSRLGSNRGRRARTLHQRESLILGTRTRARSEWALAGEYLEHFAAGIRDWQWRRGFPDVWHCPLNLWMAIGPAIARAIPVVKVITDRQPEGSPSNPLSQHRSWYRDDESRWASPPEAKSLIPAAIFDQMRTDPFDMELFGISNTYPSAACALAALSDACVNYARSQAGLPSLVPAELRSGAR